MSEPGPQTSAEAVQRAIAALAAGEIIVVIDDADRENEGDLVVAGEYITAEQMAFMVRHTTGIVCAPMPAERADALRLPPMVADNTDPHGTAFTVSVDLHDSRTGVSAAERAATVHALADPTTQPDHLRRPGHIFPLRADADGVLVRAGHTEATVDLLTLAGLSGVGVISEIVAEDGSMRTGTDLAAFAATHHLPVLAIADLIRHQRAAQRLVAPVASSVLPTAFGEFRAVAYRNTLDGTEHLALVLGDVAAANRHSLGALVRIHHECLTGDIRGSRRCDCGARLEGALQAIAAEGCGAVVYLRGHEGRGTGLGQASATHSRRDRDTGTVDPNLAHGRPLDSRSVDVGAQILTNLGMTRIRLITNSPAEYRDLSGSGLELVAHVRLLAAAPMRNVRNVRAKRQHLGHTVMGGALGAAPLEAPTVSDAVGMSS